MTEGVLIGPQLRAARKLRGIQTRRDLAGRIDRAGFGERVIGQIERGERQARDYELVWLAQALDLTVDELTREPTAEPSVPERLEAIEKAITDMRAERAQEAQQVRELLAAQDQLLERQSAILARIESAILREEDAARRDDESARRLDEAVQRAREALRASVPGPQPKARKTAPKHNQRA